MKGKHFYPAVFSQEKDDPRYTVIFPDLPGCATQGDTLDEAYEMAFAALGLYLQQDDGAFVYPPACSPLDIYLKKGEFSVLIEFDEAEYRRRHGVQMVKKTITIPSWVNAAAERMGVNFSATLTESLVHLIEQKSA
ncbi:MAG: type II toxin-antitoxin system HicB family antitoxin [Oscillospiraceae bacterium]|nr:type II toxin-antitoxin system HicB family antitoxin [Oscillospiraceae bacterium]